MDSILEQNKIFEKQIKIDNLEINYRKIGDGKIPVVLLHGWGVSSDKYLVLAEYLSQFLILPTGRQVSNFQFLIPDMPGFGKSEEPKDVWNLDNYVEFVDKFIEKVRKQHNDVLDSKVIIIGHSFGGRIAIKYAVKYPEKIDKLILTGAAGIKHKLTLKQKIFFILAKIGKIIFSLPGISYLQKLAQKILYRAAQVKDYQEASPKMKKIMKDVLREDLTPLLEKIEPATLLVWGRLDKTTPLSDGRIMNQKIKNSQLIVIENADHSLPYQKPKEFIRSIFEFLNH